MGVGFLAMLAGVLNIDQTLYEAAYIDGIKNRTQEIFYITIPQMRPQMLFGAVMAVVGTFQAGGGGWGAIEPNHNMLGINCNHIKIWVHQIHGLCFGSERCTINCLFIIESDTKNSRREGLIYGKFPRHKNQSNELS